MSTPPPPPPPPQKTPVNWPHILFQACGVIIFVSLVIWFQLPGESPADRRARRSAEIREDRAWPAVESTAHYLAEQISTNYLNRDGSFPHNLREQMAYALAQRDDIPGHLAGEFQREFLSHTKTFWGEVARGERKRKAKDAGDLSHE